MASTTKSKKPKITNKSGSSNTRKVGKVQGYLYNVGKSVTYAAMDKIKEMNPVIGSFSETNNDIFKVIYKSAIDYRTTYKRGVAAIKKSQIYEAADIGMRALKEDIMSGNLYNKEREEKLAFESIAGSSDDDFDIDISGLDDSLDDWGDFDNWDDEDILDDSATDTSKDSLQMTKGDAAVVNAIEGTAQAQANSISMALARSAEFQAETSIRNTNLLYTQNIRAFGQMNASLSALNENIGGVMKYLDSNLTTHLANSTEFFNQSTQALQDQTALLREIVDILKSGNDTDSSTDQNNNKKNKVTYGSIVDSNGMPDLKEYFKKISINTENYLNEVTGGGYGMVFNGLGEGNFLATLAANPYGFLLKSGMDKLIPKEIEKATRDFNKSLSGFFGSLITKFNTMAEDEDSSLFEQAIGKIFGVRTSRKSSIDSSKYEKGKVDWDGASRKALVEIIPNQLSEILSALTGDEQKFYDYDNGRFVRYSDLEKQYERFSKSFYKSATGDVANELYTLARNNIAFNDSEERDKFYEDIDNVLQNLYDNNKLLDINNKELSEQFYEYNVSSQKNLAAIQALFQNLPRNIIMEMNNNMNSQYASQTEAYERAEKSGKYSVLFNNNTYNKYAKEINGEKNKYKVKTAFNESNLFTKDKLGHDVFFYLQNMYRELNYIRILNENGSSGGSAAYINPLRQDFSIESDYGTAEYKNQNSTFKGAASNLIKDENKDKRSDESKKREKKQRTDERLIAENKKRVDRGEMLISIDDFDDEKGIVSAVSGNIAINKTREDLLRQKREGPKESLLEKVIKTKELTEEQANMFDKINGYLKQPMSFLQKVLEKADQNLFYMIYGKEGIHEEKNITGFMDAMIFEMKKTFRSFSDFMNEQIFDPLKENLGLDKDKSLFKGILAKLGIDEATGKAKENVKNFLQPVKESMKNAFTNVKDTVKEVLTEVTAPIRNVAQSKKEKLEQSNFFNKLKNKKNEGESEDDEDLDDYDSTTSTTKEKPKPINMVRKMKETYEENQYNAAKTNLERVIVRKSHLENIIKDTTDKSVIDDRNKVIEKQIQKEIDALDKKTDNIAHIKAYNAYNKDLGKIKSENKKLRKELANVGKDKTLTPQDRVAKMKEIKDKIKENDKKIDSITEQYQIAIGVVGNLDFVAGEYNRSVDTIRENNYKVEDDIIDRKNQLNISYLTDIAKYVKSPEYMNLSLDEKRSMIDKMFGLDKQKDMDNRIQSLTSERDRLQDSHGKIMYDDQGNELKDKDGNIQFVDNSEKIKELEDKLKEAQKQKSSMFSFNPREALKLIKSGNLDNVSPYLYQLLGDKDINNIFGDISEMEELIPDIQYTNGFNFFQRNLSNKKKDLKSKVDTRIDTLLRDKDSYGLLGINKRYDVDLRTKFQDLLSNSNFNENEQRVLISLFERAASGLDTNNENVINSLDIEDMLSHIDELREDKYSRKSSAQKAKEKYMEKTGISEEEFNKKTDLPLNKQLKAATKDLDDFEKAIANIIDIFGKKFSVKNGKMDRANNNKNIIDMLSSLSEEDTMFSNQLVEGYMKGESEFISNPKFAVKFMQEEMKNSSSIVDIAKDILSELKSLTGGSDNNRPGPFKMNLPIKNPLRNIDAPNEQNVMNGMIDDLGNVVNNSIKHYFGQRGIRGYAKGGRVDRDDLAIVGKGEYIINPRDRKEKVNSVIADMIRNMNSEKWKDNNINDKAKYLYSRIATLYGNEDIDANEIMGMITSPGEATSEFHALPTIDDQVEFAKLLDIVKLALGQRKAGNIDNYGYDTATGGETSTLFDETMQVYKKTLNKTMAAFLGDDPEKDRTKTFNAMGDILKDAKQYSPELVTGGLLGGGVSILTGMLGGPLLGAGIGAAVALTKRSKGMQDMLFGKQETDADGNPIGYAGGVIPKDIVNKAAKLFPDLKKYGITGAVAGLLPLVPFGPIPGLILGSGVAFAKNNATVQEHLFGEEGLFDKQKMDKFKKKLPNMLTGAGLAVGGKAILGLLGVGTPLGLVGTTLVGSALGFASTTEKFQQIVFGEYDPETGTYNGGIVPYIRTKIFDPLVEKGKSALDTFFGWVKRDIVDPVASAIKPITQLLGVALKGMANKIGGGIKNFFMTKFGIPILETVKNALGVITSPFKKIGKKLIGGIGQFISAPFRAIGAAGRASQRKLIKMGKADDLTAQEKLDTMNNYRQTDYFYDRAMEQKNDHKTKVTTEMSERFGEKEAIKINSLLSIGAYDKARKLVEKKFGDVQNPESIQVRDRLLASINEFEALGGIGFKTYGQKKELGNKVKSQYQEEFEAYNKQRPEGEQISFNDFVLMRDGEKATPYYSKFKGEDIYEQLKNVSNDKLQNMALQFQSIQGTDKEFNKQQYKAKQGVVNLLKSMDKGDRKTILSHMSNGNYQQAIDFLNLSMEAKGVKASDYSNYANAIESIKQYKMREEMRSKKDSTKASLVDQFKEIFGDQVDEKFIDRYMNDIIAENKARKKKGVVVTEEDEKNSVYNQEISNIDTTVTNISKTLKSILEKMNTTSQNMTEEFNSQEQQEYRASEQERLSQRTYRSEQTINTRDKKKDKLLRQLGFNGYDNTPYTLTLKSVSELEKMVEERESTFTDEEKQNLKNSRQYGYINPVKFLSNTANSQETVQKRAEKIAEYNANKYGKGEDDETESKEDNTKEESTLDEYGNEVVMKTDSRTGEKEADLSDSSTRKSINMATALREKQMQFYDSFNNLFKKNDKDEEDEKKKGGWLPKLLAALGIGKSLLGKAKGLLGGILGRGALGSLFTRGIFGALGKGALVIGGLMYLPEIISLFKNHIGPAISESWDSTIKPWLTDEMMPRLTEGLKTLVTELPSLLAGTIKFIGNELIPSILKGIGWGDQNGDGTFDAKDSAKIVSNTAVRSMVRKGSKYSASTIEAITKDVAKEGTESVAKEGAEAVVREGTEQVAKNGIKDVLKSGAKGALKGAGNFILHPVKTTAKGIVKGSKAITNAGGKALGNIFLKGDSKLIASGLKEGGEKVAEQAAKTADSSLVGKLLNMVKNQFTKILTNDRVVSLLGKVKNVPVAKQLLEKFVPKFMELISKSAGKLSGTALARAVGGVSTGGLVTAGFAVYDFISGFNNARNILGITEENVPFGYKICAGIVKTVQGLSIIATLIPTKTIMNLLINVLDGIGIDMSNIKEQQEKAQEELDAYNEQNGTNYSLEEYNKEVKGYKGIFGKVLDTGKAAVGAVGKGISWVGGGISKAGSAIGSGLEQVGEFFGEKKNQLEDWWNKSIGSVLDWFKNSFASLKDFGNKYIMQPFKDVCNLVTSGYEWVKEKLDWIPNTWNNVTSWASDKWNNVKNGAKSLFGFNKDKDETKDKSNTVSSIKTVNGMSVGQGESLFGKGSTDLNTIKNEVQNSDLGDNIKDATSDYASDKIKTNAAKYTVKGLNAVRNSTTTVADNASTISKILAKIKSGIQYVLNSKTVINILGQAENGESIAKILYSNFVPNFMKLATEKLQQAMPQAISRLSSQLLSGGMTSFAFAVTDFITGFENAESILGIVDNASFIEKVIAAVLECLKGFSIFSIVPSDLIVSLLFDTLDMAGVNTGNIGQRRENAKKIVSKYNTENNTDYNVSSYNSEVLGRKGFFSSIASGISNGLSKIGSFFGKGEEMDSANGNPYFSQKQATGNLSKMIGDAGCGPTSTAMALSKVTGQNISPEVIAKDALANKTWDSDGARGSMFSTEASKFGVKTMSAGGNFDRFDQMVSAGIPTVVSGTYGKGDSPYTSAGHIVTVFGKDKNGNYLVNDPRGKNHSKAYTKEELMNGFRNSWSFGKGEDDEVTTSDSVPQSKDISNGAKALAKPAPISVGRLLNKAVSLPFNIITSNIGTSSLVDSAAKVLQEVFTKIFTNDTVVNLLGNASNSQYSAASVLLANFVPQVVKKLKQNCENNTSDLTKYLRAIISNSNISNISFLITNFINAFNNPSTTLGKFDTYTTGMKVCAGIMAVINERFIVNKVFSSDDWLNLLQAYVMPVFGESKEDLDTLKTQAEKLVKEYNITASSSQAQKNALQDIATTGKTSTSTGNSIFSKITGAISNVTSGITSKVKSAVSSAGKVASNIGSAIGGAFNSVLSWMGGLIGKGDYVGKGKKTDPASIAQSTNSVLGINNFPYYSQYTENKNKPKLEDAGCGPTAAAMALTKVTGKDVTPDELADDGFSRGLYNQQGSTSGLFLYLGSKYGVDVKSIKDFDTVKQYAAKGVPMVIAGKGGKLYGTNADGHIVTVFGKGRNGYIVNDPSSIEASALYNENYIRNGFKEAWVFGDTGYASDVKDAESVMNTRISDKDLAIIRQQQELYGKGSDPTTLTYVNGFPYWSQVAFGGDIMNAGCGPTAAAMVFGQVTGKTLNPKDMCAEGQSKGYWSPNKGVVNADGLFGYYANKYNVSKELVSSISKVKDYAEKGYPMIVDGRCSKNSDWATNCTLTPYGADGHYVALFGKDGDDYVVNDPRGSKYSGRRSQAQMTEGFNFAYKIGDKTYSVDSSKVKNVGDGADLESSGSSSEGESSGSTATDFFTDMGTAAINFSKKLFGFDIETTESSSSTDSGGYTNVDGENTAEKIVNFMKAKGASNATVAGILGNAWCESAMNPAENNSTAFGLFQWLHQYGQWESLQKVANDMNTSWSDPVAQMNYWWQQANDTTHANRLKKLYSNGLQGWLQESDPYKSAYNFDKWFEIGGGSDKRGRTAQTIYDKYMKDGKLVNFSQFLSTGKGEDESDDYDELVQQSMNDAALFDQYFGTGDSDKINVNWGYFCDPSQGHITSYFGEKRSAYANANGEHGALDYNIKYQPLYAPKSGTVYSENEHSSYGNSVTVKTNDGNMYYRLAHMSSKSVKKGDTIKMGQQLGVSGNTGESYGAHVHFEVLSGGTSKAKNGLDPLKYYDTEKGSAGETIKLKNNDLSFKDYMDKIGATIVETNGDSSESTDSSSGETKTASGFFEDMATAVVNFSKKLFGFDIDGTVSGSSTSTSSSDSSIETVSQDDFDKSVVMGDSIASGFTNVIGKDRVVATVGHTALQGQGNIDKVVKKNPPMVIMQYGTNDSGYLGNGSKKDSWFTENYGTLIKDLKSKLPDAKMVVTQAFTPTSSPYKEYIAKVQKLIPNIASSNGASFIDSTGIDNGERTSDGIHFKDSTLYKLWLSDLTSKLVNQGSGDDIDSYFETALSGNKSSDYGIRDDEFHTGVDYAAAENTPIPSPISGKVMENIKDKDFGNTLVVRDKNGADHRFAHMKDLSSYGLGSKVRKNDIIGNVGSTGRATGSHLHYEVTKNGTSINPNNYNRDARGGSNNKLDNITLTFPESNQKVNAKLETDRAGNGEISSSNLEKLITIIIGILNKVSTNTENIAKVVEVLSELSETLSSNLGTKKSNKSVNKNTSDTESTKSSKLLSSLQKGLNDTNFDGSSTQSIISILEQLAKE